MIIVANKSGQLANRLFQFAHLIAFAAENGTTVSNPSLDEYCEYFESTSRDLFCRFPEKRSLIPHTPGRRQWVFEAAAIWTSRFAGHRALLPNGVRIIDTDLAQICYMNEPEFQAAVRNNRVVIIRGWRFRDLTAFKKHAETIRRFFEPNLTIRRNITTLMQQCRQKAEIVIGIHIRRGDYRDFMEGKYFFEVDQYRHIMDQIQGLFPSQSLLFLICSNEPLQEQSFQGLQFRFGTGHVAEDLYAFAQCDYLVGPPSTYTMWASFYGNVPHHKIIDTKYIPSLSAFSVADGNCDLPEDLRSCRVWGVRSDRSDVLVGDDV